MRKWCWGHQLYICYLKLYLYLTANIKTTFGLLNNQIQDLTDLLKESIGGCFDNHGAEGIYKRH